MKNIIWTDDLSVGIEAIDNDHKKLVAILSSLFAAGFVGVGDSMVETTLTELEDYTRYHFAREEEFLAQKNYPDLAAHKQEHQKLIAELSDCANHIRQNGITGTSSDVISFLRNWLFDHIKGHDCCFAECRAA